MKIVVFGASGLLGSAVLAELDSAGNEVLAPSHAEMDITNEKKLSSYLTGLKPKLVINCVGFNYVDECESKAELAFKVNGEAVGNLARITSSIKALFFHISSDYIFSGEKDDEYLEEDEPKPLSVYVESKLLGEKLTQEFADKFCIIRTSWLFGLGRDNFISKIVKRWKKGESEFKIVSDQQGKPTYSLDLARVIRLAVEHSLTGIYHFCNQGKVSRYQLAKEVFEIIGERPKIIPISAEQYGAIAKRPKNSALSTKKIENALKLKIRHHQLAIKDYLEKISGEIK